MTKRPNAMAKYVAIEPERGPGAMPCVLHLVVYLPDVLDEM